VGGDHNEGRGTFLDTERESSANYYPLQKFDRGRIRGRIKVGGRGGVEGKVIGGWGVRGNDTEVSVKKGPYIVGGVRCLAQAKRAGNVVGERRRGIERVLNT